MTRRPYKHSSTSEEEVFGVKSAAVCNGHGPPSPSSDDLKVQCNGLSNNLRSHKLLSPSGSDVLPLPTQRRSTRRTSASWCGSTSNLTSPQPSDSELGVTLRPRGTLWLPVALIGTTAEEHGNHARRRGDSDASDESRPRRKKLSPEEKLLQDNKDYFKMEVLNTKLRSSDQKPSRCHVGGKRTRLSNGRCGKVNSDTEDVDSVASEVKVNGIIKPKRSRRSELMKLCDEAESFMFGESSRQSAVSEDDKVDDGGHGEPARRKRRSHTEVFLTDNHDYYKFETTGSRLRSHSSSNDGERTESESSPDSLTFSFEAVPDTEPWFPVFQRQNERSETLFPVISDPANQLFLLPYELPKLPPAAVPLRSMAADYYAKRRARLKNLASLPRKSPRCHASTLAILSSLKKRKRRSSGTRDSDSSPGKPDALGLPDTSDDIEHFSLLDPAVAEPCAGTSTPARRKKTEARLTMVPADAIPIELTGNPVADIISSYWTAKESESEKPARTYTGKKRGPKKRKHRVNRTGWVKAKVRKAQKAAPVNGAITEENIVGSPRRPGSSGGGAAPSPPVSPCVVRVRKLSTNYCRNLGLKRRRRKGSNDRSWTGKRGR